MSLAFLQGIIFAATQTGAGSSTFARGKLNMAIGSMSFDVSGISIRSAEEPPTTAVPLPAGVFPLVFALFGLGALWRRLG